MSGHAINGKVIRVEPKGKGLKGEELFAIILGYEGKALSIIVDKDEMVRIFKKTLGLDYNGNNILKVASAQMTGMNITIALSK